MDKEPKTKRGAPKKRDQAVVKISEALGTVLTPDILSIEEMQGFPALKKESERNQMIMCATACGFSQPFIAKALGVSQPTINEIIQRIDPDHMFRVSPDAKKAFMTQMFQTRGTEALASITPEKLEESSASDLARIAKTMTDAAQNLNQSKHKEVSGNRLEMLMAQIENERVEDAEIIEGEG